MANKNTKTRTKMPAWEHIYLYKKLKAKARMGNYIRPKIIIEELKRMSRVPNTLHYPILKQMEEEGLIKRINHQKYEITAQEKNKKIKEINQKLKELEETGRRNRMLNAMQECGLIRPDKNTKFKILASDCDKKIEYMGNFTFW